MKKYKAFCLLCFFAMLFHGCGVEKIQKEKKRNVDFTVVSELEMTEPVKKIVEKQKTAPFKVTFSDNEYTYILIGYGKQNYAGYSITVKELYESDNAIFVKTEFSGPKEYQERQHETFPYIVVKIEYTDKNIIFSE